MSRVCSVAFVLALTGCVSDYLIGARPPEPELDAEAVGDDPTSPSSALALLGDTGTSDLEDDDADDTDEDDTDLVDTAEDDDTAAPGPVDTSVPSWGLDTFDTDGFDTDDTLPVDTGPVTAVSCTPVPTAALALCGAGVAAVAGSQTFGTVQAAIASGAAVVEVCPGTHDVEAEAVAALVLRSASGDPADTRLTGAGQHQILRTRHALEVIGLTFEDGLASYDGGAISASASAEVSCSAFHHNRAGYEGGALSLRGDARIVETVFTANFADYEGGAVSWGDWSSARLVVDGSTFERNDADYSGGAVEVGTWAQADLVQITNSSFTNNRDRHSDGVVNFDSWGGFTGLIDGCSFVGNDVAIGANGWLRNGYTLQVTNTTFVGAPGSW